MYPTRCSSGNLIGGFRPHLTGIQVSRLKQLYNRIIDEIKASNLPELHLRLVFIDNNNDPMVFTEDSDGKICYRIDWHNLFGNGMSYIEGYLVVHGGQSKFGLYSPPNNNEKLPLAVQSFLLEGPNHNLDRPSVADSIWNRTGSDFYCVYAANFHHEAICNQQEELDIPMMTYIVPTSYANV